MEELISNTPEPPYYAVIFTSIKSDNDSGYSDMAMKMLELAKNQDGFLGYESASEDIGITVSYWTDLHSISKWKNDQSHLVAQKLGRDKWYSSFKVRISKVERDYSL